MKRIAILGCENSHANAFLKFIRNREEFGDVSVVGVYSNDRTAAEKLREKFGVPVLDDYTDALGRIDGLMITARHGDEHYKFAKPYLASGIPLFIDKPITVSEDEAVSFMKQIAENAVPFCGGSSLKQDAFVKKLKEEALAGVGGKTLGGYVRAPISLDNPYGGFYFYAQHLVEMVCEIFGPFPRSVRATKKGGQIHVLFRYGEYDCVGLYCDGCYVYSAARMAEEGTSAWEIPITDDWFYEEFKEFYGLLSGEGASADRKEFIAPVFIMNAISRSLESGREEPINPIEL